MRESKDYYIGYYIWTGKNDSSFIMIYYFFRYPFQSSYSFGLNSSLLPFYSILLSFLSITTLYLKLWQCHFEDKAIFKLQCPNADYHIWEESDETMVVLFFQNKHIFYLIKITYLRKSMMKRTFTTVIFFLVVL